MSVRLFAIVGLVGGLMLAGRGLAGAEETTAPPPGAALAWRLDTPVGRVVAERPATARIFELVGIDYCCGGARTLAEAAAASSLDPARLLAALEVVGRDPTRHEDRDWTRVPVGAVIDHVVATHHAFLRRELPRIEQLAQRVVRAHGERHPELAAVQATFQGLAKDLITHIRIEEETVFPRLRRRAAAGEAASADEEEVVLREQHDAAGAALVKLRTLTRGYEVPADACPSYRELLVGLEALEQDLHRHVHLENNVLFGTARSR